MSAIQISVTGKEKIAFVGDVHFDTSTPSSRLDDYMKTCCEKIKAIGSICKTEQVSYLFFAGDIFNRIQCSHECVNRAGEALLFIKAQRVRLFSICGNHDLFRNSLVKLPQSPIETLFRFGVLEHVCSDTPVEFYLAGTQDKNPLLKVSACDYPEEIPMSDRGFKSNVLLAHRFFDKEAFLCGDDENITRDKMSRYGFDMAFLGHDHEEYPNVMCGKTLVVRRGSLLRGTAHDYNFIRKPGFIIMDDMAKPRDVRKILIPYLPYRDIVSQAVLNKKTSSSQNVNKQVLQDLAAKLSAKHDADKEEEDMVLKMVQTDTSIPDACRMILLDYINRAT